MKVSSCKLNGVKVIELDIYGDNRGFFVERYNKEKFEELGIPTHFEQDNHSRSAPGILRGLHFQPSPPQGKLVGAARGRIWDVAVDIHPESPTFGQHFGLELSDENGKLLWIPAGFAHGFCVLGDAIADVIYKCSSIYNPQGEAGIYFDDPELDISWPFEEIAGEMPLTSERDQGLQSFAEYKKNPPNWEKVLF